MAKKRNYIRNNKQSILGVTVPKAKEGKYDLSIAMIIKNEEKYLEKCLEAISVLKQHISCEIIITDTGSTDKSIEISKKYADKFLEFEWCDDFSAARNTGVNVAEGSWFMFLDADEIGDDSVIEIANFINSPNRDSYDNAYITIRNYKNLTEVAETLKGGRLFNFTRGKRYFKDIIHEHIPATVNRFDIPAIFHHFGYIKEVLPFKAERNKNYLKRLLDENPNNIDALKYNMEAEQDPAKRLELCLNTIEFIEKEKIVDDFTHSFYLSACKIYAKFGENAKFFELAEHYIQTLKNAQIYPMLEILYLTATVWKEKNNMERAAYYYSRYVKTYENIKKTPDWQFASIGGYVYTEPLSYLAGSLVAAEYYGEHGDIEKARTLIINSNAIDYTPDKKSYPFIEDVIKRAILIGDGHITYKAYKKGCENFKEDVRVFLMQSINKHFYKLNANNENYIKQGKGDRVKTFLEELTSYDENDTFISLNKLRLNNYDFDMCDAQVIENLKNEKLLFTSDVFVDVVYATLKTGKDVFNFYANTTKIEAETLISGLFQFREDFEKEMYDWLKSIDYNKLDNLINLSLYNFIASCTLTKQLDFAEQSDSEFEKMEELLEIYVKSSTLYTNSLYKPEVLKDMYMNILPVNLAFAYIVDGVIDKKNTAQSEYLAGLKKAVVYYPAMKPCVKLIGDKFQRILEGEDKVADQFQQLGVQIKQLLRTIIRQGNKAQALEILEQYKGINPNDEDIATLEYEIEVYTK